MADQVVRGGKKGRKVGRNKRSPAFMRYWAENGGRGRGYGRKIRNLIRCCGMTEKQARATLGERRTVAL